MEFKLGAPEADTAHIGVYASDLACIGKGDSVDKVVGYLVIVVGNDTHAVVEQAHVNTKVKLGGGLPLQAAVDHLGRQEHVVHIVSACRVSSKRVGTGYIVVTGLTIGSTYLEHVHFVFAHIEERLLADYPGSRHRREITPFVLAQEERASVGAERSGKDVAVGVVVIQTSEVGDESGFIILVAHAHGSCGVGTAGSENGHFVGQRALVACVQVPVVPLGPVVTDSAAHTVLAQLLVGSEVGLEVLPLRLGAGFRSAAFRAHEVGGAVDFSLRVVAAAIAVIVERILGGTGEPVGDPGLEVHAAHEFLALCLTVIECLVELGGLLVLVGTAGGEGTVGILADMGRRHHDTTSKDRKVVVGHGVLDSVGIVERGGSGEPLGHVEGGVAVHREVLVGAHRHHTVVSHITYGGSVLYVFVAAVHAHVLLMIQRRMIPLVLPVVVGVDYGLAGIDRVGHAKVSGGNGFSGHQITGGISRSSLGVADTRAVGSVEHQSCIGAHEGGGTDDSEELRSIGKFPSACRRGKAHLRVEHHLGLLESVALLGGNEDNTVGCTATVDGG